MKKALENRRKKNNDPVYSGVKNGLITMATGWIVAYFFYGIGITYAIIAVPIALFIGSMEYVIKKIMKKPVCRQMVIGFFASWLIAQLVFTAVMVCLAGR